MLKNIIPLILFFLLTPGILWTYSKKHNKYSIALLHAFVFAFVFYFINETFSNTPIREGMKEIKGISFELEKNMKTDEVNKALINIIKKARTKYGKGLKISLSYDNEDGENKLKVIYAGGSSGINTTKKEIMDPNAKEIFKFIEKVKNM